jgi:hypothetical protein
VFVLISCEFLPVLFVTMVRALDQLYPGMLLRSQLIKEIRLDCPKLMPAFLHFEAPLVSVSSCAKLLYNLFVPSLLALCGIYL